MKLITVPVYFQCCGLQRNPDLEVFLFLNHLELSQPLLCPVAVL